MYKRDPYNHYNFYNPYNIPTIKNMQTNKKQIKTALPGNGFKQADLVELVYELDTAKNETLDIIKDYFSIGGIEWPIELLADSLHALFSNRDQWEMGLLDGTEQYLPPYKLLSHSKLEDTVFFYSQTMQFFAKLSDKNQRTAFLRQRLREREINEQ
jgi:hypothetical protein